MKKFIFMLLAVGAGMLSSCGIDVNEAVNITRVNPLTKVFPETVAFRQCTGAVEVAGGEHAIFQYAVSSAFKIHQLKVETFTLKADDGSVLDDVKTGFVSNVGVGYISKWFSAAENDQLKTSTNLYPDPIIPAEEYEVPAGQTQAVWITVSIPKDARAGLYKADVTISGKIDGRTFRSRQPVEVKVYPVSIEEPTLWNTNWYQPHYFSYLNGGKNVERFSTEYYKFLRILADKMKESHQNVALIDPWLINIGFEEGRYTFDYTEFDRHADVFKEAGVLKMLEVGHIGIRDYSTAAKFYNTDIIYRVPVWTDGKMEMKSLTYNDPRTVSFYKQFFPALVVHLKEKNYGERWVLHVGDEPVDNIADSYIGMSKIIREVAPEIKILDASQTTKLTGYIDIWCPTLHRYDRDYPFYKDRQEKGDEVWFYTCCDPEGEYMNRFIDMPLIKTRLLYWLAFYYGATGYLHWGFNSWDQGDPYREVTSYGHGGGDHFIVYPGDGEIYNSIRFEAMRDGLEDYALLEQLQKKDPEKARQLCGNIIQGFRKYMKDPDTFLRVRHQILEALTE